MVSYDPSTSESQYIQYMIDASPRGGGPGDIGHYGMFSYDMTQRADGQTLLLYDREIISNGVSNEMNDALIFTNPGIYNIQYRIQFINEDQVNSHEAFIWFARNVDDIDEFIDNSTSSYTIPPNSNAFAVVGNFMVDIEEADGEIRIYWDVSDDDMVFITVPTPDDIPDNPSVLITVQEVTGTGPQGPQGPQGLPGGGGGNPIYNDTWINTNIIDPPPAITFDTAGVVRRPTSVFIPWTNYTQIPSGAIGYLPVSTGFRAVLNNAVNPLPLSNPTINPPYNLGDTTAQGCCQGIVLNRTQGNNNQAKIDGRRVYNVYNVALNNANNTLVANYFNYNPGQVAESTIIFGGYMGGNPGVPGVPGNTIPPNTTPTSVRILYTAALPLDPPEAGSTVTVVAYFVSYVTPGSSTRFGGPAPQNADPFTVQNVTNPNITGLFPECTYNFSVYARNSLGNDGAASNSIPNTISTANLLPNIVLGSLSFPAQYYTPGAVSGITIHIVATPATTVPGLLNLNNGAGVVVGLQSDIFSSPINTEATRGNIPTEGTVISSLAVTSTNVVGPMISYTGFPIPKIPVSQVTLNNITLFTQDILDSYPNINGQDGYYLYSENFVLLDPQFFNASNIEQRVTVTNTQNGAQTEDSDFSYYYDGIISAPTVQNSHFQVVGANPNRMVSGVTILNNTQNFTQTLSGVRNLGDFFYCSPYLEMTLSVGGVVTSPNTGSLNDITPLPNNRIQYPIEGVEISTTIQSGDLTNIFNLALNNVTLSGRLNSAGTLQNNNATEVGYTKLSCVIDGGSIAHLASQNYPSEVLPLALGTEIPGCRVYSGITTVVGLNNKPVPTYTYGGTIQYIDTLYQQSWNITNTTGDTPTNQELQMSNGFYRSKGNPASASAYLDYTPYFGNAGVNYSTIPTDGYRYTTFAWTIPTITTNYTTLSFTLNNIIGGYTISPTTGQIMIGNSRLQIYYRFENKTSPNPFLSTTQQLGTISSNWIDGNNTDPTVVSAANYGNDNTVPYQYTILSGLSGLTINPSQPNKIVIKVSFPPFNPTEGVVQHLYCRIGLPMDKTFSFKYVAANINKNIN
jgi:hypothetical protein